MGEGILSFWRNSPLFWKSVRLLKGLLEEENQSNKHEEEERRASLSLEMNCSLLLSHLAKYVEEMESMDKNRRGVPQGRRWGTSWLGGFLLFTWMDCCYHPTTPKQVWIHGEHNHPSHRMLLKRCIILSDWGEQKGVEPVGFLSLLLHLFKGNELQ